MTESRQTERRRDIDSKIDIDRHRLTDRQTNMQPGTQTGRLIHKYAYF